MSLLAFVDNAFGAAQRFVGDAYETAEDAVCDTWMALIPEPVRNGLTATQQEPWRSIWRGANLTIASAAPFLVMPFTLPLALFFYPILIWLETTRLAFAVVANCGRISTTLKNEAGDLLGIIDVLSPRTAQGRLARGILNAAGASNLVDSYDTIAPSLRTILTQIHTQEELSLSALISFATASAGLAGDAEFADWIHEADRNIREVEQNLEAAVAAVNASTSSRTSGNTLTIHTGAPGQFTVHPTSPPYYSDEEMNDMFGESKAAGAGVVVGLGIAGAVAYWLSKRKR